MKTDFYIFQYLKILHNHGTAFIELYCKRGFFCHCLDDGYNSDTNNPGEYTDYISELKYCYLKPSIEPITIYQDNQYVNTRFKEKYDDLINYYLLEPTKHWKDSGELIENKTDIITIHKIETRILNS